MSYYSHTLFWGMNAARQNLDFWFSEEALSEGAFFVHKKKRSTKAPLFQ